MSKYEELTNKIDKWQSYLDSKKKEYQHKHMSVAMFNRLENIRQKIETWETERESL